MGPAFAGLGGDDEPCIEDTGLDCVLNRKVKRSVAEARTFLRGYSWTTVCPAERSIETSSLVPVSGRLEDFAVTLPGFIGADPDVQVFQNELKLEASARTAAACRRPP
ncbi:hypothetical protein [Streptomyces sp. GC420]|uniref:hypothetical protein n=1 Tax=Streptomyces sp. GC420 TaxID=2697568 RepID=UPI0014150CBB|nr:hypothetical protein [Streptomyces sp. GC420]NBM15799.1 hypothetical protein [Streptomyces sp. GC420]